jgi:hypothetical protein
MSIKQTRLTAFVTISLLGASVTLASSQYTSVRSDSSLRRHFNGLFHDELHSEPRLTGTLTAYGTDATDPRSKTSLP